MIMKAKIIKRFRDKKNENKFNSVGSTYESSEERVKELQGLGYLGNEVEEKQEPAKKEQPKQKKKVETEK